MKISKGFAILLVLSTFIIFNSCLNEPHFSNVPEIGLEDIYFIVTPKIQDADTLFLVLSFKDGDGDLGLPSDNLDFISTPYNQNNFFLEKDGLLKPIGFSIRYSNNKRFKIIDVTNNATGTLVTTATRNKPGYETLLHPYEYPYTVTEYTYDTIYVMGKDKAIFEGSITPVDTLSGDGETYFALLDIFYFQPNENYRNIDVTFEIPTGKTDPITGEKIYDPFDWTKTDQIISPFNQRFPVLGDSGPLEGTLKYAMTYQDFLNIFNNNVLRLSIQIKDRALNRSNIVHTNEFTLQGIRRK